MSIRDRLDRVQREQREAERAYEITIQQEERRKQLEAQMTEEAKRTQEEIQKQQHLRGLNQTGTAQSLLELKKALPFLTRSRLEISAESSYALARLTFGSGEKEGSITAYLNSDGLSVNGTQVRDWQENPGAIEEALVQAYLNPERPYVPYKSPRFGRRSGGNDKGGSSSGGHSNTGEGGDCCHCLSKGSLVSTPSGDIKVENLKTGDVVWTNNSNGKRIKSKIIKAAKVSVQKNHMMLKVTTIDNTTIIVSPEHPDRNGIPLIKALRNLDLNQVNIKNVELIKYKNKFTYDILPEGETGNYWANGILLGSTLSSDFRHNLAHAI